jgi:hypothetical protein
MSTKSFNTYALQPAPKPQVAHLPLLDVRTLPNTVLMQVLGRALSLKRDHGSDTEAQFVSWLVSQLPVTMIDIHGNVHVDLRSHEDHRTLFTAHTDTVHRSGGANKVRVDGHMWRADSAPLGADDGAGVALMCHLIHHQVPAYYIFFRGEECGGVGSSALAENNPELLGDFDRAVAFDRAGYHDVITHQGMGRCCSDTFAAALSEALTSDDFTIAYTPCDGGVYTDTAEFVDIIPECTNLSVGYARQHGEWEEQDVHFLQQLSLQLLMVRWDELPTARDPQEELRASRYAPWSNAPKGSKTKVTATTQTVVLESEQSFEGNYLQYSYTDEDIAAMDACEAWLGNQTRLQLLDLIAETISPEYPEIVRKTLSINRLSDDDVSQALENLYDGWPAEGVLSDLFDTCQVH